MFARHKMYQLASLSTLTQTQLATWFTQKVKMGRSFVPSTTVNVSYCVAKTQVQSLNGLKCNSTSAAAKTLYTSGN
jgi:hypothetical protein